MTYCYHVEAEYFGDRQLKLEVERSNYLFVADLEGSQNLGQPTGIEIQRCVIVSFYVLLATLRREPPGDRSSSHLCCS